MKIDLQKPQMSTGLQPSRDSRHQDNAEQRIVADRANHDVTRQTIESDGQNAEPPFHAADECVLEEMGES